MGMELYKKNWDLDSFIVESLLTYLLSICEFEQTTDDGVVMA